MKQAIVNGWAQIFGKACDLATEGRNEEARILLEICRAITATYKKQTTT